MELAVVIENSVLWGKRLAEASKLAFLPCCFATIYHNMFIQAGIPNLNEVKREAGCVEQQQTQDAILIVVAGREEKKYTFPPKIHSYILAAVQRHTTLFS